MIRGFFHTRLWERCTIPSIRPEVNLIKIRSEGWNYCGALHGRAAIKPQDKESHDLAFALYTKALDIDPDLAEAYAGLGLVQVGRYSNGWGHGLSELEEAEANCKHALTLDPSMTAAYEQLTTINFFKCQREEILKIGQKVAGLGREDAEYLRGCA